MNFIDRIRIRNNPNIIDSWRNVKVTEDVIEYAIYNGYQFKLLSPLKIDWYVQFNAYREKFKKAPDFIEYVKTEARLRGSLTEMYNIYGKSETLEMLKTDIDLAKTMLQRRIDGLAEEDIVEIVSGNESLIEEAIKNYSWLGSMNNKALARFIATIKTPQELQQMGVDIEDVNKGFIEIADVDKIMQLLSSGKDGLQDLYGPDLQKVIKQNIVKFIPYLEGMDELCSRQLLDDEIKEKTLAYLKENQIVYNDVIPQFALEDMEYVFMCLQLDPSISGKGEELYVPLEGDTELIKKIADKIAVEQISFENIPLMYQECREIYETIIKANPELLKKKYNTKGLDKITGEMTEQEELEYYKSIGYPFSAETVKKENFLIVLECLKKDYMTLAETAREFSLEQYEQIYETLKDTVSAEEILGSKFLTQNPYFIMDLLEKKVDLEKVDLSQTKKYEEMYLPLKAIAIKNDVDISIPAKGYKGAIKFIGNKVYVSLDDLTSVREGLQYIQENGFSQDLLVGLRQGELDEAVIADNIEFFEKLQENGVNINFSYNIYSAIIPLKEVLRMEHFMQDVVEDIKSKNFSPLEQLIAVYDISKRFKPYKIGEHAPDSRALYEYLESKYMVCAGYADLIVNLGHRLNAPYSEIVLQIGDEGHARNYVNLIDEKYGINGFYVLEPTWDNNEISNWSEKTEQKKSLYRNFLLTTEEGRREDISLDIGKYGGYDILLTMQTPEEIRKYFSKEKFYGNEWYERIRLLDPEFYKKMVTLDFEKDEDAQVLIDYFKTKVNNPVPKEKLLDAIMEVKKSIYVNLTEQDFEDMRMAYSMTSPFCKINEEGKKESLYGEQYIEYIKRRYEDIKSQTIEQAQKGNTCLDIEAVLKEVREDILKSTGTIRQGQWDNLIEITDEKIAQLAEEKKDLLQECGFPYIDEQTELSKEGGIKRIAVIGDIRAIDETNNELTIQENIESFRLRIEQLCQMLGVTKEVSTQELGKETLEEQNDTAGKQNVLTDIVRHIEEPQTVIDGKNEHE